MTDKLKPCPFCGGEVILEKNELDCWVVRCTKCPLDFGRYWFAKKQQAKNKWKRCENIADYLLANGVIVPPCKVGDTVYSLMECTCEDIDGVHTPCEYYTEIAEKMCSHPKGDCPYEYRIAECIVTDMNLLHFTKKWGKTVFLTKEEAEEKLKELNK